jgi:glc operon protein GlcG
MRTTLSLDSDDAARLVRLALDSAARRAARVSVAVMDQAGGLLQFSRAEGAGPHTVDLALKKARISALVGRPTRMIEEAVSRRLTPAVDTGGAGGLAIIHDGACVGAIGVSGALPDMDHEIAEAAVSELELRIA